MVAREAPREYRVDYKEALGLKGRVIYDATRDTMHDGPGEDSQSCAPRFVAFFPSVLFFFFLSLFFFLFETRIKSATDYRNYYDVPIASVVRFLAFVLSFWHPCPVSIEETRRDNGYWYWKREMDTRNINILVRLIQAKCYGLVRTATVYIITLW